MIIKELVGRRRKNSFVLFLLFCFALFWFGFGFGFCFVLFCFVVVLVCLFVCLRVCLFVCFWIFFLVLIRGKGGEGDLFLTLGRTAQYCRKQDNHRYVELSTQSSRCLLTNSLYSVINSIYMFFFCFWTLVCRRTCVKKRESFQDVGISKFSYAPLIRAP